MAERLKILLSGMVAGDPHQGGATWAVLQYVHGLRALGHDVLLVEPLRRREGGAHRAQTVAYFESLPLAGGAVLLEEKRGEAIGMPLDDVFAFAADADLLINISGMLRDERLLESIPVRAFLDLDPGFNQVWHVQGEERGVDQHTHLVTVGLRLGESDCPIPDLGREWIKIPPPVSLAHWPAVHEAPSRDAFTSVGHWRSYGATMHDGIHYGQRAHSLRELIALPRHSHPRFQLALGIHPDEKADLEALRRNEWELLDPLLVAGDPDGYASFVRSSKAELSIAKSGYVASRGGWFSDRSACYLASGRPVVAQETGFGRSLPTGEGLLSFTDLEGAVAAVDAVEGNWQRHSRAARELAVEYFDAEKVLSGLLATLASAESTSL